MKFKISYFYKIRFFEPWQIPVSTAVFDPKWYHDNKGQNYVYEDKRGVYNGIRYPKLSPKFADVYDDCRGKEGIGTLCDGDPTKCRFLEKYSSYLDSLDFDEIINSFKKLCDGLTQKSGVENPEIVLIVHEPPTTPCSERGSLIKFFEKHNITVEEF